jgi:sodium-dependent dicarboxylate transporter 2/3/5
MNSAFWLAPLIGILLLLLPVPVSPEGHRMLAIVGFSSTLWITEAIPLPATALLAAVLTILLGVASATDVLVIFADPIIFLFIGSFILAEAMHVHRLDRRFAHGILRLKWVRAKSGRILFAFSAIAFVISMWVSNTATTAMMYPIALSIIAAFPQKKIVGPFILLLTSFSASIGGMGTPVGTPPNLIGIGFLRNLAHESISFPGWMKFALPIAFLTFVAIYWTMRATLAKDLKNREIEELPAEVYDAPTRKAQNNVAVAFGITVFLWLLPSLVGLFGGNQDWWESRIPESVAALIGALILFLLPVNWRERKFTITWAEAQNINWGIILLFGGGLVIGKFLFKTGVAQVLGDSLASIFPFHSEFAYVLLFTILAVFISEFTSNTASANLILPICIAVSQGAAINPYKPALAATLASSLGFMLPISTAPNAIVFGSGLISIRTMVRYGIALDLIGALIVALGVYVLV